MFKRQNRLSAEKDIKLVLKKGKRTRGDFMQLVVRSNELEQSRFSVVVGIKVSKKAVERNRVKRQVRSIIEAFLSDIKPRFDVLIMLSPRALGKDFEELTEDTKKVFKKAKLL